MDDLHSERLSREHVSTEYTNMPTVLHSTAVSANRIIVWATIPAHHISDYVLLLSLQLSHLCLFICKNDTPQLQNN